VIVVDTSAIIAILQDEPEAEAFADRLAAVPACYASAVSYQEAAMVLAGRTGGSQMWRRLDNLIARSRMEIIPHDLELARIAREAFLTFGKGRHPAALNCGDCATYALAKARGLPLLFKGQDFARTDIIPAIAAA
jgi:ribonuclease VapC